MKLCSQAFLALIALPFATVGLQAVEFGPSGPRSVGMGGSSVAVANDGLAALHNPAFLATAPRRTTNEETGEDEMSGRFGLNIIDVTAGVTLSGDVGDYLDTLSEIDIDDLANRSAGDLTADDARNLLRLSSALANVDNPGNGLLFKASGGAALRFGNWSVGARMRGHAAVRVDELDTTNLGFDSLSIAQLNTDLSGQYTGTPTGTTLSQGQKDSLTSSGLTAANVDYLDSLLTDLVNSGQVNAADINEAVDLLTSVVQSTDTAGSDLDNNTTLVTARGIGLAEIPIGYGYAVTPEFSIGATLRLMMGRVYGTALLVFEENNDEVIDEIDSSYETSFNATLDLGIRYQYGDLVLAAVGRNLTAPKFDGFVTENGVKIDDVTLDPQVTIGAAYELLPRLVLTAEGDLLESEPLLRGVDEQFIRAGVEWDPIRFLELRFGAYDNIAENDLDVTLTGGVGFDFGAVRMDFSAALSPFDTVEYDGDEYPQSATISFGLSAGF